MNNGIKFLKRFHIIKFLSKYIRSRYVYLSNLNLLKINSKYENKYGGKRCFIVANGPSLNTQNLELIKDEYTFGVNNLMITEKYDQLLPKFYTIVDYKFFHDEYKVLTDNLKKLATKEHKPICIFPVIHKKYIERNGLDKDLEIIWIAHDINRGKKIRKDIRLSQLIPFSYNVANVALFTALSMGFTEIYLLGVDMTGVLHTYNEEYEFSDAGHFFKSDLHLAEYESKKFQSFKNESMLKLYLGTFYCFRQAFEYANRRGVKIINLTSSGALDVFPLGKYEDIVKFF